MSKCDVQIQFDRSDRTYRSGEQVSGTVRLSPQKDLNSKQVLLEHFWQTHGRGNTDRGAVEHRVVARGDLRAGQTYEYPFEFTAPSGPPTYHGHHLNIDHYVRVRVDIPWAFDPKQQEEYVLLAGDNAYGHLPTQQHLQGISKLKNWGAPVAVLLLVLGCLFVFPFGIVLIPLGLVLLFFSLRKSWAERRLGEVQLQLPTLEAVPGTKLPVQLSFTPRKAATIDEVTVTLVGREQCVSGSGTNKTTHTHKLYEQKTKLAGTSQLVPAKPVVLKGAVQVPQTTAYSFASSDNHVIWELSVRIDIPMWPDWVETRAVVVRPALASGGSPFVVDAEVVKETPAAALDPEPVVSTLYPGKTTMRANVSEAPTTSPRGLQREPLASERLAATEPVSARDATSTEPRVAESETPPPSASNRSSKELRDLLDKIVATDRYGREREELVQQAADAVFDGEVTVDRIERTFTYVPDERFRNGRTVTGKLADSEHQVSLQITSARNEQIDQLSDGKTLQLPCRIVKWNSLYDRAELREL